MKQLLRIALLLLTFTATTSAIAQCQGCVPDQGCTTSPPFPTLCPANAPDATAGEYYQADFTFWMPPTFTDPGSGVTVTLQQLTITGVSGLPFGLAFTASSPTGIYLPAENEFGCARVCGTPLWPGEYTVSISVLAQVNASGFTLNVPQTFDAGLVVLPGSGGNASFSYSPSFGCGSVTAQFQALIDASPAPMSWSWDFGNGNSSNSPNPPAQVYNAAGTYQVSLQTTIGGYVLNQVVLSSVNSNWCGDVDEPSLPIIGCVGAPDLFFVLTNASGGTYQSSTIDNVTSATWSNLGLLLDNPPYSITFWDSDVLPPNDALGTYNITLGSTGTLSFNVAGGTAGSLQVSIEPQQVFNDTAQVVVLPNPSTTLTLNGSTGQLCASGYGLVSYAWLLDGQPVQGFDAACVQPSGPGLWQVVGLNSAGCSDTSNTVVVCPVFEILRNNNVLFVPSGYVSYAWTFNGAPIGGNSAFVFLQGDGVYGVTVEAGNGCTLQLTYVHDTTGIDEPAAGAARLEAFPSPSNGRFTIVAEGLSGASADVLVLDMTGRAVWSRRAGLSQGALRMDVAVDAAPGTYLVRVLSGHGSITRRVLIR
jgi:PKD repeat protein